MDDSKPDDPTVADSQWIARISGVLFLLYTVLAMLHYTLIEQHLLVEHGARRIASFVREQALLFDVGIAHDLLLFQFGTALAFALRALLRRTHGELSLQALGWMLMANTLALAIELSSFAARALAQGGRYAALLDDTQRYAWLLLAAGLRADGYTLTMVFFAPGMGLFAWLLLRSGYVPAAVGGCGVLAAGLLFAATLARIATTSLPALASVSEAIVQGAAVLAMLFQLAAGAWLIARSRTRAGPQPA